MSKFLAIVELSDEAITEGWPEDAPGGVAASIGAMLHEVVDSSGRAHVPHVSVENVPLGAEVNVVKRRKRTAADPGLLTPAEVAELFRVDPKTVTRWSKDGKLESIRTLGGHRRYEESKIRELLNTPLQKP